MDCGSDTIFIHVILGRALCLSMSFALPKFKILRTAIFFFFLGFRKKKKKNDETTCFTKRNFHYLFYPLIKKLEILKIGEKKVPKLKGLGC